MNNNSPERLAEPTFESKVLQHRAKPKEKIDALLTTLANRVEWCKTNKPERYEAELENLKILVAYIKEKEDMIQALQAAGNEMTRQKLVADENLTEYKEQVKADNMWRIFKERWKPEKAKERQAIEYKLEFTEQPKTPL